MVDRILELLESENPEDFELANNILEAQEIQLSDYTISQLTYIKNGYIREDKNGTAYHPSTKYIFRRKGQYRISRKTELEIFLEETDMRFLWGK